MEKYKDLCLKGGDHGASAQGYPFYIEGDALLVQQAMICLTVPKGRYPYNEDFGSRLHTLQGQGERADAHAFAMVAEALQPVPEIRVQSVSCTSPYPDQRMVQVALKIRDATYMVEVSTH